LQAENVDTPRRSGLLDGQNALAECLLTLRRARWRLKPPIWQFWLVPSCKPWHQDP